MTIADDIKTVLTNQASIVTAVNGIATKLGTLPAGQTVDLTEELDLLKGIKTDLEPTPAPDAASTENPAPATGGDQTANAVNTAAAAATTASPSA